MSLRFATEGKDPIWDKEIKYPQLGII